MTYNPKTARKCTFIKLNEETAKRASLGRRKKVKESKRKAKSIKEDKIKRLKEFESWWK